ncbi:hypothetical protein ACEVQ6_00710 [Ciceribacter sp. sgz301302]
MSSPTALRAASLPGWHPSAKNRPALIEAEQWSGLETPREQTMIPRTPTQMGLDRRGESGRRRLETKMNLSNRDKEGAQPEFSYQSK